MISDKNGARDSSSTKSVKVSVAGFLGGQKTEWPACGQHQSRAARASAAENPTAPACQTSHSAMPLCVPVM